LVLSLISGDEKEGQPKVKTMLHSLTISEKNQAARRGNIHEEQRGV